MTRRPLGRTGLEAFVLGLGGNRLAAAPDRAEARATFDRALDCGVNLIDLADAYGRGESERLVGEWTRGRRDDLILCSKVGYRPALSVVLGRWVDPIRRIMPAPPSRGSSRDTPRPKANFAPRTLRAGISGSLRRLRTDRLDVFYLHSPAPEVVADDDVYETLERERKAGRIRHHGISFPGSATTEDVLTGLGRPGVSIVQIRVNRDSIVDIDLVAKVAGPAGVAVVAREVFQKGTLLGPDAPSAQEALRAVVDRPGIDAVLVGMTNRAHLDENLAAVTA